jgi:hypothetical protein
MIAAVIFCLGCVACTILGFYFAIAKRQLWGWLLGLAGLGMMLLIIGGVFGMKRAASAGIEEMQELTQREAKARTVAYQYIADYLQTTHPDSKAVVFDPSGPIRQMTQVKGAGMREGLLGAAPGGVLIAALDGKVEILHVEDFTVVATGLDKKPTIEEIAAAMSPSFAQYEEAVAKYPTTTMIIFLGAPPAEWRTLKCLQGDSPAKVVMLGQMLVGMGDDIKNGTIVAAMAVNPTGSYGEELPKDPQAAFDSRYLLVTPDNVSEMIEKGKVFGL